MYTDMDKFVYASALPLRAAPDWANIHADARKHLDSSRNCGSHFEVCSNLYPTLARAKGKQKQIETRVPT
jgi:hypothetical protein